MAAVTPDGKITLCHNVPLSNNYAHSIYFSSRSAQKSYFSTGGIAKKDLLHQNYVKTENGKIRVEADANELDMVNYMWWENGKIGSDEPSHRVYAFVTNIDYVSPNVSEITYEVDVLQTYVIGEDIFGECLIERRTPAVKDSEGHSISFADRLEREPFNINPSDFEYVKIPADNTFFDGDYTNWKVLAYIAYDPSEGDTKPSMGLVAGAYQGVKAWVFDSMNEFSTWLNDHHGSYNDIVQRIINVTTIPGEFPVTDRHLLGSSSIVHRSKIIEQFNKEWSGNWKPKYQKVYTYPYNCCYITDGTNTGEYAYEYFKPTDSEYRPEFEMYIVYQPNPEIMIVPKNYKGMKYNYDESLVMNDLPQVPFISDSYKQYMGTKDSTRMLSVLKGAITGAGAGLIKGANPLSAAVGGVIGGSVAAEVQQAQTEYNGFPVTSHGSSATAIAVAGAKTFMHYQKRLRKDVAQRLDSFFKRFGYAYNKIDKPSAAISNGRNQKYIKTCGCMVKNSNCPAEFARKIENIFNSGITWWDKDHIGDYN